MVSPTTFSPRARSIPATTELSTPPDMATAMVCSGIGWRQLPQMRHGFSNRVDERVNLCLIVGTAERETDAGFGLLASKADGEEDGRGIGLTAGTSGTGGNGETSEVERDEQGLAV